MKSASNLQNRKKYEENLNLASKSLVSFSLFDLHHGNNIISSRESILTKITI